jgi:nucleoside phosphorylase
VFKQHAKMPPSKLSHDDYTVAWICALPLEMTAAKAMLDEVHDRLPQPESDNNAYTLGCVYGHHVVIACLQSGVYGTASAATAVAEMRSTFASLRFGLMVGIGGGVPGKTDIRLGDVVISKPTIHGSGVIQYDYGKTLRDGRFQRTAHLNKPHPVLLNAMSQVESNHMSKRQVKQIIADVLGNNEDMKEKCFRPTKDLLFHASYPHHDNARDCAACDLNELSHRSPRETDEPYLHFGLIASGNQVMKDAQSRDQVAQDLDILCFEMEAAGLMDQLQCLVIRGICDYCDSHKQKQWQGYASLTAAACAKFILSIVPLSTRRQKPNKTEFDREETACLKALFITDPSEDKNALKRRKGDRAPDTCEWILEKQEFQNWLSSHGHRDNILWLYGNPGTGKSTMAITMVELLHDRPEFKNGENVLAYFFCDSSVPERSTATSILRGLLYQIVKQRPDLMQHLFCKWKERTAKVFNSFDGLWNIVLDMGQTGTEVELYCIIDALDECDRESQDELLKQITQTLGSDYRKASNLHIHFLITSRPYPEIRRFLYEFNSKDLSSYEEVQKDLEILIEKKVTQLSLRNRYSKNVASSVSNILKQKAEGTFLWVGIACDELAHVRSRKAVETLQTLPQGLNALYMNLITTALDRHENDNETIFQILSIVAIARRPFTLAELHIACHLYQDEDEETRLNFIREDIEMRRLMVVIQDEIVHLLHKSVKDFLLRYGQGGVPMNELKANSVLANRCISYAAISNAWSPNKFKTGPRPNFLTYAVEYWPDHASAAKTEFIISPENMWFFQPESREWSNWSSDYYRLTNQPVRNIPIWHVIAKWGIESLVDFLLPDDNEEKYVDIQWIMERETPIALAIKAGNAQMAVRLLDKAGPRPIIDGSVVAAAVGHTQYSDPEWEKAMGSLLDRQIGCMKITSRAIGAFNPIGWNSNKMEIRKEIMLWLLSPERGDVEIEPLAAAKICGYFDTETVQILLAHHGDQVEVTANLLKAAARNEIEGEKVMKFLLQQRRDVEITANIVMIAVKNSKFGYQIMVLLLDQRRDIRITEDIVMTAARYADGRTMNLILDRYGSHFEITEKILIVAAENPREDTIKVLLDRSRSHIEITEKVFIAAANNWTEDVMNMLLDRSGSHFEITEEILIAAASNSMEAVIKVLLDRSESHFEITEKVFIAAANNPCEDVMALLLDRSESHFEITEKVFIAAANYWTEDMLNMLLDRSGSHFEITEEVFIAAASNPREGVMNMLLDRRNHFEITEKVFIAAANNPCEDVMALLLDRFGCHFDITEEHLMAAISNCVSGEEILGHLLDQQDDQVEATQNADDATRPDSAMKSLQDHRRRSQIKITHDIIRVAARKHGIMEVLLDRRAGQIRITQDIVDAASTKVLQLLHDRREQINITEEASMSLDRRMKESRDWDI